MAVLLIMAISCVDDSQLYDTRELWIGSWTCSEIEGDFAPQTYPVEIVERVILTEVGLKGLYNQGLSFTVIAEIIYSLGNSRAVRRHFTHCLFVES